MPFAVGTVGPQLFGDGTQAAQGYRQNRDGDICVSELHGRYKENAARGNLYTASAIAVATSTVGTAMVGLQLWNASPSSGPSARYIALLKNSGMVVVTSATTTSLWLAFGTGQTSAPTSTTAVSAITSNLLAPGSTTNLGVGRAFNAGTFVNAPVNVWPLLHNTAAIGTTGEDPGYNFDWEGSIIIPPQSYVAVAAVGAALAASGGNHSIMWSEFVP